MVVKPTYMYRQTQMALRIAVMAVYVCGCVHAQTGLSEAEKQQLLDAHNHFRSRVNPTAANMERMVWNDELADTAQNYAELCIFDHNPAASQSSSFVFVGENLAITTTLQASLSYSNLVQAWYEEVQYYDYTSNACATGEVCGHHTQVVWAESDNLGCGVYRCSQTQNFAYYNALNLVCNYGPAGNFRGQFPYVAGSTSCLMCPGDKPYCVNNLCSPTQLSVSGEDDDVDDNGSNSPAVSLSLLSLLIVAALFILF